MTTMSTYVSYARRARRPALVAVSTGALYGSWSAVAHLGLGPRIALQAGLTQLFLSAATTLVLTLVLDRVFRWPANPRHGFWLAPAVTTVLATVWLALGNSLAGTPHIAIAIAPSVVVGAVGCFVYARVLLRAATHPTSESPSAP